MTALGVVSPKHPSRFFALPSTSVGKWSGRLLALSMVLVLLNSLVVMPYTEARTGPQPAQSVFNMLVGLCAVASGVSGLVAVVAKREHSWVVWFAIGVVAVVLLLMVQDFSTPG